MAVTVNKTTKRQEGLLGNAPVEEATHLYEGTLAFFNVAGFLVGIVAAGLNVFAGVMRGEVDNSLGDDGDLNGEFWAQGDFSMYGTGFSQATVGLDIYASDNYTVTTSNAGTTRVGRCVRYISSTEIVVKIGEDIPLSLNGVLRTEHTLTPVAAAGTTVADAGQLGSASVVHITSDGATKGVKLPTGVKDMLMIVINDSATAAELYAATGGTVNGLAANASVVVPASKGVLCLCSAADTWIVYDLPAKATAS